MTRAEPELETLRYPIGRFRYDTEATREQRAGWIAAIEELPRRMSQSVAGLDDAQLDTPTDPTGGPSASSCTTSRTAT